MVIMRDLAAFVCVMVVNWLAAATNILGGQRTGDISKKYATVVDPAPWAFSIWGIIYISLIFDHFLIGGGISELLQDYSFVAMCVCNCLWLVLWGYEAFFLSHPILIAYGVFAWRVFQLNPTKISSALHFGWLLCAITVGTPVVLKSYGLEVNRVVASALLLILGAVSSFFSLAAFGSVWVAVVLAWASAAIYSRQGLYAALFNCILAAGMIAKGFFFE